MKKLMEKVKGFMKNEEGQGLVEYALIIALIALVVIAALRILGGSVNTKYTEINTQLTATQ
ncbi:MAG: Flp family type IVb pilin [Nitrospirae bacterium]|nr:Flp family type IVb pilin [Nitrospirota bacterium]